MNGQIPLPTTNSSHSSIFRERHRLVAALVISCLLHISLLTAAYLGGSGKEDPLAASKARISPRPFSASLKVSEPLKSAVFQDSSAPVERTQGMGLMPFPAPPYYPTDQLSKRPQPLGSADLDAPEISLIVASGRMILKIWINESGEVVDVEIEKTDLPEVFSRTTQAAFKRLRFTPGERGGVRVGSVMKIEVNYDDGRLAAP